MTDPHICETPAIDLGRTETWVCGVCGRIYFPGLRGWVEIQGPTGDCE